MQQEQRVSQDFIAIFVHILGEGVVDQCHGNSPLILHVSKNFLFSPLALFSS
jgi:hypothetical protein